MSATADDAPHVRVAIMGTGFSGLGMALQLLARGERDFVVFDKADDVGGTWRDNTYPGCQCDVPSVLYSLSSHPNPEWSRTYSPQAEIQTYLQRCAREVPADKIKLGHEITDAQWDDSGRHWRIMTSQGPWTADVLVAGHGGLSAPAVPDIAGLDEFEGAVFHSAQWDHDHDLTGGNVAVIGTGASAIQIVPQIQPKVRSLTLFQRTPPWVLPHTDRPTSRLERAVYRRFPTVHRLQRNLVYWVRELIFLAMAKPSWLTRRIEMLGRAHLARQVPDPELRRRLTPDYAPGCKRLLLSNQYYPALSADNADVVTEKIQRVGPRSISTVDGNEHEVDTIILATGFKVTNHPVLELIRDGAGRSLAQTWREKGMQAYLGTTVSGFPNLFLLGGPNTGTGHTSVVFMAEAQMTYVLDALRTLDRPDVAAVEVRPDVVRAFNAAVQRRMQPTVWSSGGCASWYLDAHGRNTTLWPDFTWKFRVRTRRFDAERYRLIAPADLAGARS